VRRGRLRGTDRRGHRRPRGRRQADDLPLAAVQGACLLEALAVKADLFVTTDDHDSYPADLRAFLADSVALGRRPPIADVLRFLMAEAQIDPAFRQVFRTEFLQRRRAALQLLVDRAAAHGDLPPRPAPSTTLDMVFGVIWYRLLTTDHPADDGLVDELVDVLAPGRPEN
jgi:hypothetical protein